MKKPSKQKNTYNVNDETFIAIQNLTKLSQAGNILCDIDLENCDIIKLKDLSDIFNKIEKIKKKLRKWKRKMDM